MYSTGITNNDFAGRVSFWTKKEKDDLVSYQESADGKPSPLLRYTSPEPVNFEFDQFSSDRKERKGPRDFITILLGGGTNVWSNVDFAAAFATCVTGSPVLAHITKTSEPVQTLQERKPFINVAARVRPGLAAVMTEGTAFKTLSQSAKGQAALAVLESFRKIPNVEIYSKTGTLRAAEGSRNTSRIVLAIVKWKDRAKGMVESGMVFSIVGEKAHIGQASEWLGEFLVANQAYISRKL
jgi:hypothetical protein